MAVLTGIELCAGVGMLGEGVRAALGFLGHEYRTVCYVEREASAAGQLVTLMEAGIVDPAPCWSDMLTFDGAAWRGKVDCIIAGFPCQDLSIAGRRAGLDGERSGLFFRVCDIADDCGAQFLILENVSAIASAAASVVDQAVASEITGERYRPAGDALGESDSVVQERAAARVMGELADRGWDSEWITLSASDVGASHRRARWFCFAWRLADPRRSPAWRQQYESGASGEPSKHQSSGQTMAHTSRHVGSGLDGEAGRRRGIRKSGEAVGQSSSVGQRERRPEPAREPRRLDVAEYGGSMADAQDTNGRGQHQPEGAGSGWRGPSRISAVVADTISPRLQERTGGGSNHESLQQAERPDALSVCDALGIFAPGPDSTDWHGILETFPFLAPATEPGVRMLAHGNSYLVDESRSHQLRAIGNGVVPLCAATALVTLVRRAGIGIE